MALNFKFSHMEIFCTTDSVRDIVCCFEIYQFIKRFTCMAHREHNTFLKSLRKSVVCLIV